MRIVFIGCVHLSGRTLEHLISLSGCAFEVAGIITKKSSAFNSDFESLVPLAQKWGIPYFEGDAQSQDAQSVWLREKSPDVIYCFGWSHLLTSDILKIPKLGVIGYHPSLLPRGRGRHPLIWTLALGLKQIGSTFFFMNEGADDGDILNQKIIPVEESDDSGTLYRKLVDSACRQITDFTKELVEGRCRRVSQDHAQATYWRKRTKTDGQIDWRMPAAGIHNLVRALTRPYPGAHFMHKGVEYKVWKTGLVKADEDISFIEPGKVLNVRDGVPTVKCADGLIQLMEHECRQVQAGEYLY